MTPDRGQRSKVNLTLPCGQYTALRLGAALDASDRLGEAEAAYRKVLELSPLRELARAYLALNLLAQGRNNEGLANAKREPSEGLRLWALAIIQHTAGRRAQSNAALQELIANCQTDAAYQIAEVYGARGAVDLAFDWLERAYVQRDGGLTDTKTSLVFAHCTPIRGGMPSCARWASRTRQIGVAPYRRRREVGRDRSRCPLPAARMYGRCWPFSDHQI